MAAPVPVRVGPAGWSYEDWAGIVYPARPPRGFDRLTAIASLFDVVEVNSTFYRIPPVSQTESWPERVAGNARFAFTAKLFRGFTHERDAGGAEEQAFRDALAPLEDSHRLGAVLIQFPFSFHATAPNRAYLGDLLDRLEDLPLAVEFRHEAWNSPETLEGLARHRAAFVNIDQPRLSDNLGATAHVTAPLAYFRFHGRNAGSWFAENAASHERYDYLYGEDELAPWVDRIRGAARALASSDSPAAEVAEGTRRVDPRAAARGVYAILNNHFRGQAVSNALTLQHELTGEVREVPESLIETHPATARVARAAPGPRRLF
ncbi:MAG TPA: DUF72 domain-containing protein [Thermoanaerobaculia bacterium]